MKAVVLGACAVAWCVGAGAAGQVMPADEMARQVDAVVRETCGKSVVLLGESPVHGFARTLEFKVAVAERLIAECRFSGVFFESGAYDFLRLQRLADAQQPVTPAMMQAAIGGLWANTETARLVPALVEGVRAGRVRAGGVDDQLGRDTWAQREVATHLTRHLSGEGQADCLATLRRHTEWQYTNDAPYGPADTTKMIGCLDRIDAAILAADADDRAMVANLKRMLTRDLPAAGGANPADARDRSMVQNFEWLMAGMPAGSKVIVWTATTHAAKDLTGVPGNMATPMGAAIHRSYGDRAFALGFTALSGRYALGRQAPKTLDAAPPDTLEARAFAGDAQTIRYFNREALATLGPVPARPLGVTFKTARWDTVLDGLIVFREEHPPTPLSSSGG